MVKGCLSCCGSISNNCWAAGWLPLVQLLDRLLNAKSVQAAEVS